MSRNAEKLEVHELGPAGYEGAGPWWRLDVASVEQLMTPTAHFVGLDATIRDVAMFMRQQDVGAVPLVWEDGRLYGLVTDRDIVVRGLAEGRPIDDLQAKDLATRDLEAVTKNSSVGQALRVMARRQLRRLPVVDDADKLVGMITLSDIARRGDHGDALDHLLARIAADRSL
jgi:CBS domain-containing protein